MYLSGTVQPAPGAVLNFMQTTLHNALVNTGWVYVKEWRPTTGTTTYTCRTYRNPVANSGEVADFYVTILVNDAGTALFVNLHGTFDAATNTLGVLGFITTATTNTTLAMSSTGVHTGSITNPTTTSGGGGSYSSIGYRDDGFVYYMSVTNKRLVLAASHLSACIYAGAFTPLYTPTTVPPLFAGPVNSDAWGEGSLCQNPTVTSAQTVTNGLRAYAKADISVSFANVVDAISGGWNLGVVRVCSMATGHSGIAGNFIDMVWGQHTTSAIGDEYTAGADTYVVCQLTDVNGFIAMKKA